MKMKPALCLNFAMAILILGLGLVGCLNQEKTATSKTGSGGIPGTSEGDLSTTEDADRDVVSRLAELLEDCPGGDLACLARRQALASVPLVEFEDSDCRPEATPFGGGDGTPTRPFLICSPTHLYNIRTAPSRHYFQTRDIDLRGYLTLASGANFESIPEFSGVYDGHGHYILNLVLRSVPLVSGTGGPVRLDGQGLFSVVRFAGVVRNLRFRTASVSSDVLRPMGVLAGINHGSFLDVAVVDSSINVNVAPASSDSGSRAGFVAGTNAGLIQRVTVANSLAYMVRTGVTAADYAAGARYDQVGGIAGRNEGLIVQANAAGTLNLLGYESRLGGITGFNSGEISESVSAVRIVRAGTGQDFGGIAGVNEGRIAKSRNTGVLSGALRVGGIAGYNLRGVIDDCDNAGSVTSSTFSGGIAGGNEEGRILSSRHTGAVYGNRDVGGIAGINGVAPSLISQCAARNRVGTSALIGHHVGGIVGRNHGDIQRSSSIAVVYGQREVAGMVGFNASTGVVENSYSQNIAQTSSADAGYYIAGGIALNDGEIRDSYSTTQVRATAGATTGGLIAVSGSGSSVVSSYWDRTRNPSLSPTGPGEARTTAQLYDVRNFSGWDFTAIWNSPSSGVLPTLRP